MPRNPSAENVRLRVGPHPRTTLITSNPTVVSGRFSCNTRTPKAYAFTTTTRIGIKRDLAKRSRLPGSLSGDSRQSACIITKPWLVPAVVALTVSCGILMLLLWRHEKVTSERMTRAVSRMKLAGKKTFSPYTECRESLLCELNCALTGMAKQFSELSVIPKGVAASLNSRS